MSHRATLSDLIDALTQNMTTVDIAQTVLHIELSQKIRKARKKLGMSQKDLAEKMGVKQSLVSRWESSECNYTIDTLVEIADALGLSVRCPLTFNEAEVPTIPVEERPAGRKVEFPAVSFSDSARPNFKVAGRPVSESNYEGSVA